ncbi:MAG: hypothetical protein M3144_07100 [Actinomycetota bacterium]|nr:hypothetical protein [Actinomycetota bacterium]
MPPPRHRSSGRRPVPVRRSARPKRTGASPNAKQAASRAAAAIGSNAPAAVNADDVLDLQREAGNRAVTISIQRNGKKGADPLGIPLDRYGIPRHGPDVRAELRGRLPGLLGALTPAQLDQWQAIVDWHYVHSRVQSEWTKNEVGYLPPQVGFPRPPDPVTRAIHEASPEYQRRKRQLETYGRQQRPPEDLTVDARLLFSDDIHQQPEWDVKAEMEFREWAIAQITAAPIKIDPRPSASWHEALAQWPITAKNTKGFITAETLRQQFPKEYSERVANRKELKDIAELLTLLRNTNVEMRVEHQERSDINARKIGFGIVRHISEAVGSGSTPYPSIKMWDQADALHEKAITAFNLGQYELSVPLTAMAEKATTDAAERYVKYEKRVTSGASRVIKALEVLKGAGTIAAGIATSGLGLTGAALAAGGYHAAQEGAQRAAEMYYGQRKNFGLADLLQKAGITSVMTLMGGPLQARFQVALKARLDKVPGLANSWFGRVAVSGLASASSSVYMTSAEIAMKEIVSGNAIPKSAAEFADMIVDNAVQSVVMDAATNRLNSRAGREYAAWKAGRGTSTASTSGFRHQLGTPLTAPDTPAASMAGAQAAKTLPPESVSAMLKQGAGWKQHVGELEAGVGLGATMPVAERRALIDRFEAYREQMARNVGTVFGGEVAITGTSDAKKLEVRFAGADAAQKVAQAQEYLDAKSPGWRKQTDLQLTEAAPIATGKAPAQGVGSELQIRMGASIRHMAAEFVPVFDKWRTLKTPQARAEAMLEIINRPLTAAGAPPVRYKIVNEPYEGQLITQDWEIHVSPAQFAGADITPAKFARLCEVFAHEGRHALQFWRMARIDPAAAHDLDPTVKQAAVDANSGKRPAEELLPSSLKYKEAQEFLENVYGANAEKRNEILTDMKVSLEDMTAARQALADADTKQLPLNHPDRVLAQQKYETAARVHADAERRYLAFAEEIDARQVGESAAAAVKERLAHRRALENAQVAEREAYAAYQRAITALTGGDLKYRHRLEKRQELLREALAKWKAALEKMKKYEANLANLAKPKAPAAPTSGASGTP